LQQHLLTGHAGSTGLPTKSGIETQIYWYRLLLRYRSTGLPTKSGIETSIFQILLLLSQARSTGLPTKSGIETITSWLN